jgi:ATP-binding cassette, subfamily B, bacterial PglK
VLQTFRKLRNLLGARERRNALLVFAMMLILGLLEAGGVASIMPFLAVLMNPSIVHSNTYLAALYSRLAFSDASGFLFFLAATVFVVVVGRIAFAALTQYATARYSAALGYTLTTRLLEKYLRQPYVWFLHRHSSDLGRSVLAQVEEVIGGSLMPGLQLVTQASVTTSIVVVLIAAAPAIAVSVMLVLGGAYTAVYLCARNYLGRIGDEQFAASVERFQIAHEVLAGIKEVKVSGLETAYLQRFRAAADRLARRKAASKIIGQLPRYMFEAVALGGMLIVVMMLLARSHGDVPKVVVVVGLYAFAGLRLLPALQSIYSSLTTISFSRAGLDALYADLAATSAPDTLSRPRDAAPLPLHKFLELHDVTYAYPLRERPVLINVTLSIPARTTVGFVGATGAGKTTVVDIILGLLEPQQGEVLVDGTPIGRDNVRAWQRTIGYVPQHIFLADDTVAANIAFGVPLHKIDMRAVEGAARYAELHAFVTEELPQGYETVIGERGLRLSGGQRQRIAIARALYHDPDVLILDEATSSLDNVTERAIMDALHNLAHVKTILIIAHRLSTVRACDNIIFLAHGRVTAVGTFEELLACDAGFAKLAVAAE